MTTITSAEQWTFAGIDLSSYATFVTQVQGADELPPLRGSDAPYTGVPGRLPVPKLFDGRTVSLALIVTATDAGGGITGTGRQQARANMDALKTVLGVRGTNALTRKMPDGTTRTAQAECIAVSSVQDPSGGEVFQLLAEFFLADPFFYGANVVDSARSFAASPLNYSLTLPGSIRTHRVTFDLLGATNGPITITNNTTGTSVTFNPNVPGGQHLVIDSDAFTALLAGASVIGSLSHSGAVPFFWFNPGVNAITITASAAGGSVTTTLKVPYL